MHNADKKYNYTKLMLAMLACTKKCHFDCFVRVLRGKLKVITQIHLAFWKGHKKILIAFSSTTINLQILPLLKESMELPVWNFLSWVFPAKIWGPRRRCPWRSKRTWTRSVPRRCWSSCETRPFWFDDAGVKQARVFVTCKLCKASLIGLSLNKWYKNKHYLNETFVFCKWHWGQMS